MQVVPVSRIVTDGSATLDTNRVGDLAGSIAKIGLINPISVVETLDGYRIVAGRYRLEAVKSLGWTEAPVTVAPVDMAELIEIDENLIRRELHFIERADLLARRKAIYEALYPEAKPEAKSKENLKQFARTETRFASVEQETFATDTAKKVGLTDRSIQQDIQLATNLSEEVKETIKALDIPKREALILAREDQDTQREIIDKIKDTVSNGKKPRSVTSAKAAIKVERVKSSVGQVRSLPDGEYDVILADPPWRYEFSPTSGRAIEQHYPTMPPDEITSLDIPAAANSILFLWATAPKLPEALEVMQAWGFSYRTCAVWDKEAVGVGYWFRGQHELLLVGVRGRFSPPPPEVRVSSVIRQKREGHSEKPEVVYEIIERMYPGARYIELFARSEREGWDVWGNQVEA